jgi:cell division protein ZapA (FtsZ GTPase activity inhibitor)
MENDLFNITIKIAEKSFRPRIKRSEEALYRQAADYVDKKLSKFIKQHPKQDMSTYLSLVSLELAIELLKEKDERNFVVDRIKILEKELDENLKK